jgi:hypothetical protein
MVIQACPERTGNWLELKQSDGHGLVPLMGVEVSESSPGSSEGP